MTNLAKLVAIAALMMLSMSVSAAAAVDCDAPVQKDEIAVQISLIDACRTVTMNDAELKACTDGIVVEVLARIGVQ